jgi:hypothetical protein
MTVVRLLGESGVTYEKLVEVVKADGLPMPPSIPRPDRSTIPPSEDGG